MEIDKHKLANLLNRICLAAELVERNPEKCEKYIGMIRASSKEAISLLVRSEND